MSKMKMKKKTGNIKRIVTTMIWFNKIINKKKNNKMMFIIVNREKSN